MGPRCRSTQSNAKDTTLLTTKAHGSVMEGLLILLPCQAKTFRLQVAVVVRLITCQTNTEGGCQNPNLSNKKMVDVQSPKIFHETS